MKVDNETQLGDLQRFLDENGILLTAQSRGKAPNKTYTATIEFKYMDSSVWTERRAQSTSFSLALAKVIGIWEDTHCATPRMSRRFFNKE